MLAQIDKWIKAQLVAIDYTRMYGLKYYAICFPIIMMALITVYEVLALVPSIY